MKNSAMNEESVPSVREQCRAVLSIWTERRTVKTVCRDLGIRRPVLMQWQDRAMAGMMQALSPREVREEQKPALAVRVRRLVERYAAEQTGTPPRLARRWAAVTENRGEPATPAGTS